MPYLLFFYFVRFVLVLGLVLVCFGWLFLFFFFSSFLLPAVRGSFGSQHLVLVAGQIESREVRLLADRLVDGVTSWQAGPRTTL